MIKKLRFWVHCIRGFLSTYEEAVNEYNINPLDGILDGKKKRPRETPVSKAGK
jgi:hypothetical protein